jgi:hypothetical protein
MRLVANVRAMLHHSLQGNKKAQHNSLYQDRFSVEVVQAVLLNTPQG